jgi:fermentation-respiration switch protein FrsA (DUF1100 family)
MTRVLRLGAVLPALALALAPALALAAGVSGCGQAAARSTITTTVTTTRTTTTTSTSTTTASTTSPGQPTGDAAPAGQQRYAVGERTLVFVDHSRSIHPPGRPRQPRTLVTVIRYPTAGPPSDRDRVDAAPLSGHGAFPLIVFGHGFAVTPRPYAPLLRAWAQAGYVVAAPVFPLENADAPGGPDESDLVNQPRDMRFVITEMLAASADPQSPLAGTIDRTQIAVTGQSDGGETALAVAYDRFYLDPRVRAAMILSGAELPGVGGFTFPEPSPPLLAVQGTADTINEPHFTNAFFAAARRPKFLLRLLGAGHLPPYTTEQPQLKIVERVTVAFLDRYLKHDPGAAARMGADGQVPGMARLIARP